MLKRAIGGVLSRLVGASTVGFRCAHSFSRHAMYRQIEVFSRSLPSRAGRILDVSGSEYLAGVMGLDRSDVTRVAYPDVSIFELPFANDSFDWVVSDQCLEHLEGDPRDAIRECLRVLKPGGRMLHTTCFMTAYHGGGGLGDYWRFSAGGLALLCSDADDVVADGVGHPIPNLLNSFIGHVPVPVVSWHPLTKVAEMNSRGHAALVWVQAKKRAPDSKRTVEAQVSGAPGVDP